MTVANLHYFSSDSDAAARSGMRPDSGEVIASGTFLARFSSEAAAAGPRRLAFNWWWRFTEVRKTFADARDRNVSLSESIQASVAIVMAWRNDCRMIVCVRYKADLGAYVGSGKIVDRHGAIDGPGRDPWHSANKCGAVDRPFGGALAAGAVAIPDPSYLQLYIPGLAEDPALRALLEVKKVMNLDFLTRQLRRGDIRVGNLPLMLAQL